MPEHPKTTSLADGTLGTRRARQLMTIGADHARGGLMPEELTELALDALADWARRHMENLGEGVTRRMKVIDVDNDHIDVEVRLTGCREPRHLYRINIRVEEPL